MLSKNQRKRQKKVILKGECSLKKNRQKYREFSKIERGHVFRNASEIEELINKENEKDRVRAERET